MKRVRFFLVTITFFSSFSYGENSPKLNVNKLLDIAGKQRMLSQRIAKDYLYVGKRVATSKADKELKASIIEFLSIHKELESKILDPEIRNLLEFVALSSDDLKKQSDKDFTLDNAQLILDLTEAMLEGNQYIVDTLKETYKVKKTNLLDLAAKQRMLSQRIAKYYIAYQSGIKDSNTISSMKETVKQFDDNLQVLLKNKNNSKVINHKLKEIEKLWSIVNKFYINIEKGGLPLIVFNTTDNITKKMDEITKLYLSSK